MQRKTLRKPNKEIDKLEQELAALERQIMQETTGYSSVADAANAFSESWLDAYKVWLNTADAIGEKFEEDD